MFSNGHVTSGKGDFYLCSCFAYIEVTQDIINRCNSPGGSSYPLPKRPHNINLAFVLHVFKSSCNAHIMLFFGHFKVYAYQTMEIFLQKKALNFYFNTRNHFRDEILDLLSIPGCLQLSKMLICSK